MTRYLLLCDSYGLVLVGRPLWREVGSVFLYVLLALASAVFLGSKSLETRDHILLSQIWDFPFRRLLRLAGSRWRYFKIIISWNWTDIMFTDRVTSPEASQANDGYSYQALLIIDVSVCFCDNSNDTSAYIGARDISCNYISAVR
jgi:hypothetical protein